MGRMRNSLAASATRSLAIKYGALSKERDALKEENERLLAENQMLWDENNELKLKKGKQDERIRFNKKDLPPM